MRVSFKAVLLAACAQLVVATGASAQVDLIVKMKPDGVGSLSRRVSALSKGEQMGPDDTLFRNVLSASPVFPSRNGQTLGKDAPRDIFVLSLSDSATFRTALAQWSAESDVSWAIPNHRYRVEAFDDTYNDTYNDTYFDSLGHLERIRALEAWTVTTGTPDVRIGIIDTGIFMDHPDFAGQLAVNPGEDLNGNGILDDADINGIDDDGNGYVDDVLGYDFVDRPEAVDPGDYQVRDFDASEDRLQPGLPNRLGLGHGTLVAGIAGAALNNGEGVAGVAPGARLVPLRAFGVDGLGDDDDVSAAIVYAAEQGIDVVNLSFGDTYYSPLMAEAVRYAAALGTTVVASGGNAGTDAPHYPSDYPEVIGALWLDRDGEHRGSRASFGVGIDVGAPGSFIFTTLLPPPSDLPDTELADSLLYGYRSGSSVAAPQIAGVAALLRSVDKSLSPSSIKAILTSTATDLAAPGWDHQTASGRVDAASALELPYPASVSIISPEHQSGFQGSLDIRGTVLNPLFENYSVWFAPEVEGEEPSWSLIAGPTSTQISDGLLAKWDATGLPDGSYLLRLQVTLKDGRTIEDRRRVFLDRTPPRVDVVVGDAALIAGKIGIQAEIESDDLATAELVVTYNGQEYRRASDRVALRHGKGLKWIDEGGLGGSADFHVEVRNVAGLTTVSPTTTVVVPRRPLPGYVTEQTLDTPAGFLLPKAADLDTDNIPEIVLNRYIDGWLGDTVKVLEWAGTDFRPSIELLSNAFPRDVGDTDHDGNPELLLQVSAIAQLVEFSDHGRSAQLVYLDTAGIKNPSVDSAAWGALLGDIDGDGKGEIIVHNRKAWRILEWNGSTYEETVRLVNPTPPQEGRPDLLGSEVNGFAEPEAVIDDLDGDGLEELIVTDTDGDFIVYESTGDNMVEPVWWYQTNRFTNQGSRLVTGDFDGDGKREFIGFVHSWPSARDDGEYEAPLGIYYRFEVSGDNTFNLVDSLVVSGNLSNQGAITAVDLDGDDADELVIAHPPNLYIVKPDPLMRWQILYARQQPKSMGMSEGIRSVSLVGGDFDGNGVSEFMAAGADQKLHKFEWSSSGTRHPTPEWLQAYPRDAQSVALKWLSTADSVAVYRASGESTFDLLAVVTDDSLSDIATGPVRYRIRSLFPDGPSAFSTIRSVRPHDPGVVSSIEWVKDYLSVLFTEPVEHDVAPDMFVLASGDELLSVQAGEGGRRLLLRFQDTPAPGDTLRWKVLRDVDGTLFADTYVLIPSREGADGGLFLASWRAESESEARLVFNLPLDPASAGDVRNYVVKPTGQVESAMLDIARPEEVLIRVRDRSLGPTGLKTTIVVRNLRAQDGTHLGSEGTVATFAAVAQSTEEAYVFPNPYRAAEHEQRIMIAGLPRSANIEIYSPQGEPVRFLEETDGDGGVPWDLRDLHGELVPSGIYIVLIQSEGQKTVTLKLAVLR